MNPTLIPPLWKHYTLHIVFTQSNVVYQCGVVSQSCFSKSNSTLITIFGEHATPVAICGLLPWQPDFFHQKYASMEEYHWEILINKVTPYYDLFSQLSWKWKIHRLSLVYRLNTVIFNFQVCVSQGIQPTINHKSPFRRIVQHDHHYQPWTPSVTCGGSWDSHGIPMDVLPRCFCLRPWGTKFILPHNYAFQGTSNRHGSEPSCWLWPHGLHPST